MRLTLTAQRERSDWPLQRMISAVRNKGFMEEVMSLKP